MRARGQPIIAGARGLVETWGARLTRGLSILSRWPTDNHGNAAAPDLGYSRNHLTPVAGTMPDADNSDDLSGGIDPIDNEVWPDCDQLPCTPS